MSAPDSTAFTNVTNPEAVDVGEDAYDAAGIRAGGAALKTTTSRKAKLLRDESSLSSEGDINTSAAADDADLNLPPGRMNAVKGTHRLQGSGSNLVGMLHMNSSMSKLGTETSRSRSKSPSMKERQKERSASLGAIGTGYTSTTNDGNSSISSGEDGNSAHTGLGPDNDIFTDRFGFYDDMADNVRRMHNSREFLNLPPTVNERMTEDSLEDTHAFSDLQVRTRSSNASLVSGVSSVANEAVLEPLDECEEGLEDSDYEDDEVDEDGNPTNVEGSGNKKKKIHPTIILTNMENLNLHQQRIIEEDENEGGYHDNTECNAFIGDDETDIYDSECNERTEEKYPRHEESTAAETVMRSVAESSASPT